MLPMVAPAYFPTILPMLPSDPTTIPCLGHCAISHLPAFPSTWEIPLHFSRANLNVLSEVFAMVQWFSSFRMYQNAL